MKNEVFHGVVGMNLCVAAIQEMILIRIHLQINIVNLVQSTIAL